MEANDERRHDARKPYEKPIIYADESKEYYYRGRTLNFSDGGLCFECESALKPGQKVYTMRKNKRDPEIFEYYRPDAAGADTSDDFLGEVRWCRPIKWKETDDGYDIGLLYTTGGNA